MNTHAARAVLIAGVLLGSTQCAAPMDGSVDEAPEAVQRASVDVPRWTVYQTGHDFYYGTAVNEIGRHVKHYYAHPRDLDRFSRLVAIPPGGEDHPETWRFLSATGAWMRGDAYFTEDLRLSTRDARGILLGLREAGSEPPQLPASFRGRGAAPGHLPERPPAGAAPVELGPSRRNVENGIGPEDVPVGKYPGWNRHVHPGDTWQTFRCHGVVYEGYRSDCPDFMALPIGDRWRAAFEAWRRNVSEDDAG